MRGELADRTPRSDGSSAAGGTKCLKPNMFDHRKEEAKEIPIEFMIPQLVRNMKS